MLAQQIIGLCLFGLTRSHNHTSLKSLRQVQQRLSHTIVASSPSNCTKPNCTKCNSNSKRRYSRSCDVSYEDTKAFADLLKIYNFCECLGEKLRYTERDDEDNHGHGHGHKRGHKKHNRDREEEIRRMKMKAVKMLFGIRGAIRPDIFDKYYRACETRRFGKCFRLIKHCLGLSPGTSDMSYYSDRKYWDRRFKKMGGFFKSFCFYDKNVDCFSNKNVWEMKTKNHSNQNSQEFFLPKSCISPFTHVYATTPTEDFGYMNGLVGTDSSWMALLDEYKKKIAELVKCEHRNGKISTEAVILHLRLKIVSYLTITCRTAYSGVHVDVKQNEIVKILNYMLNGTFDWFLSSFAGSLKAQCQK